MITPNSIVEEDVCLSRRYYCCLLLDTEKVWVKNTTLYYSLSGT